MPGTGDDKGSMVRALSFADTFIIGGQSNTPTLWVGTNAGTVLIHQVTIPQGAKRDSDAVKCILVKEIQLQHRAPVINVCVLDRNSQPLPAPFEVQHERSKPADMTGHHQVLIASEEQLKMFALPNLKPLNKLKLTAVEGSRIRRVGAINFRSRSDERYSENDVVCLTNSGDVQVMSLPLLRRQLKDECISRDNITGIVSAIFTSNGEGFYQSSPSEFSRFSVSARFVTTPCCTIDLPQGVRDSLIDRIANENRPSSAAGAGNSVTPNSSGPSNQTHSSHHDRTDNQDHNRSNDSRGPNDSTVSEGHNVTNDSVFSGDIVQVHVSEIITPRAAVVLNKHLSDESVVTSTPIKKTLFSDSSVTVTTTTMTTVGASE